MATLGMTLFFISGAAVGSFLNVLIARYDPERSLFDFRKLLGWSHCMSCKKRLGFWELIPIASFVFLRGKCSACRNSIGLRYLLVELASGTMFLAVPLVLISRYAWNGKIFFLLLAPWWHYAIAGVWVAAFLVFLLVAAIDVKHYLIPDELNVILAVLGLSLASLMSAFGTELPVFSESFLRHYALLFPHFQNQFAAHALGGLIAGAFFMALAAITRFRGMGMGDVKFMAASGVLFGWPDISLGIFFGFVFGGAAAGILYASRKRGMKDMVPFGPFLALGLVALFCVGYQALNLYFSILG
jgi:leader peptidase (prepilin peptidase)/N-methyltransferase